ncbi:hypothetical protein P171DRAFT_489357 [Karstenula rhodostoma CBS 690.94]|uniref:Uncharacterized protein n=1 Tax=Karstenula rhodostoma CBS 690.94 TaxID=1392251 RepID=A0A9P4U8A1_9PLEO|nr:hypothetical protein P171DRAFT_489357 [Karstenula rhodostoma CBS 690.94]
METPTTDANNRSPEGSGLPPIMDAAYCFESAFSALLCSTSSSHYERIEEAQALFRVWAGSLGVSAEFHASLDYRVRDSETARLLCLSQLEALQDALSRLSEIQSAGGFHSHATIASKLPRSSGLRIQIPKDVRSVQIQNLIDRLYRLAKEIRRPSSLSHASRAEHYAPLDEFGNNVIKEFERFITKLINIRLSRNIY